MSAGWTASMSVTREDFHRLSQAIAPLDTDYRRDAYRSGDFPRADLVHDLNKRYRWDLYWAAEAYRDLSGNYKSSEMYTALRRVVPEL